LLRATRAESTALPARLPSFCASVTRASARDHDLAELQRIRSEREVLLDDAAARRRDLPP